MTVASLFEALRVPANAPSPPPPPSPLARVAAQPLWTDPASGYMRRNVSPLCCSPIRLVDVRFPSGARVAHDIGPRQADVQQQVWMFDGSMTVTVGTTPWRLHAGDCLAMQLDQPVVYSNQGRKPARYLVALVTMPIP